MSSAYAQAFRGPVAKPQNGAITGLGAGNTAVIKLGIGLTYETLVIRMAKAGVPATRADMETMLGNIRITVSGDEKMNISVKQLIADVEYYFPGAIADSGNLVIPFWRSYMESVDAQLGPNYGTTDQTSIVVEIAQLGGSTIDSMVVIPRINPLAEALGAHIITRKWTIPCPSAGVFQYADLPRNPGEVLYSLMIEVPTIADLTSLAYVPDDNRQTDLTLADLATFAKLSSPQRAVQTAKNIAILDFVPRGYETDALPVGLLSSQVLELNFSTAVGGRVAQIIGKYGKIGSAAR